MSLTQRVAVNTVVQVAGRVISLILGLVTLRLMTTYLGVSTFGEYSVVLAVTGTVAIVAELGAATILARELSKTPEAADDLGGIFLRFRLVTSVAAGALVLAATPFLPYTHETKVALALSIPGVVFTAMGSFLYAFFETNLRMEYAAALDVGARALGLVAIIVVRVVDGGLYGLVGLRVATAIAICVATFVLARPFWRMNMRFDRVRAMPLIRSSIGIGLISTIGLIAFRGDAIWLSLLRPPDDVGIYSVAYRFVDQSLALPAMFLATVFPILTRALHTDRDIASRRINRASQLLALLGILGALAMYSLAPPLVHLIGGTQFEASVRPLRVLALAVPCLFVAPVFYNVLVALDRRLDLAVIAVLVLSFDVAVNFTLIPKYGYMGAAIATISTQCFALAALLTCARWRYPFALDLGFVVRVVAAALAAVAILKVVPTESPWVEWISAEGVFLLGVVALGVVRLADIRLLTERRRPE